jgi:hypothetical protein
MSDSVTKKDSHRQIQNQHMKRNKAPTLNPIHDEHDGQKQG